MAKVFTETYSADETHCVRADEVVRGGTGYGLGTKLPDEVEHMFPDYGIYGAADMAYGFLTRGCPRKCAFCIVSEKEGARSRKVADVAEFRDAQPCVRLLDPNLLAAPEADALLGQLAASGAQVDFTQGLDIRLLDRERATLLKKVRIKTVHFAWDSPQEDLAPMFGRAKEWLGYDHRKLSAYVLTNFGSTHAEDLYRVETLRRLGYSPYVMVYDKPAAPPETRRLQRYCNNRIIFRSCARFEDYDPRMG
jgi:hypothetical protein